MSWKVSAWVMEYAPVKSPAEQAILYALADRAHDDGTCAWPSQSWIAKMTMMSDRTVRRHLAALEERGVIVRGDQRVVQHIPKATRPVVWNLAIWLRRTPPDKMTGPDTGVRTPPDNGDRTPRTPVSDKPPLNHPYEPPTTSLGDTRPDEPPKRATAHRLPDGWSPDSDTVADLTEKCPTVDQAWELEKFRDYFLAAPDRTGRKLDWTATYRNWIRRAAERPAPRGVSRPAPKRSGWDWEDTTGVIDAEVITQLEIE